jgi:hypothetical protein
VMGTPNKFAQALRDVAIPMVSRLAPFQHAFVQRLSELGIAYSGSPIVDGSGRQYFDDSMRGGKGIGSRFLVVVGEEQEAATKEAARQLCETLGEVAEFRSAQHPGITLVRPDGYVAYSTQGHDSVSALEDVRALLMRQTAPSGSSAPHGVGRSAAQ